MDKVKIISTVYSIEVTNKIIKKIFTTDFREDNYPNNSLSNKLRKRNEVKDVNYKDGEKKLGDKRGTKIYITILTDSVNNPNKNQKYWQEICQVIENHIKEM